MTTGILWRGPGLQSRESSRLFLFWVKNMTNTI
jgi:hypothetical protein